MSMASVRSAIAAYLNTGVGSATEDAAIPTLNNIYRAMPTFIDPAKWWELPAELGAGTIGYVHLATIDEIPSDTQATMYEGDEWVDGYDAMLEGVKALIRIDPNLGTAQTTVGTGQPGVIYAAFPGVIWQAGQAKGGLRITADLPFRDEDGGEVLSMQVLEFRVTECITA
jgi:hypothetical protein